MYRITGLGHLPIYRIRQGRRRQPDYRIRRPGLDRISLRLRSPELVEQVHKLQMLPRPLASVIADTLHDRHRCILGASEHFAATRDVSRALKLKARKAQAPAL